jgi:hypothetical protein
MLAFIKAAKTLVSACISATNLRRLPMARNAKLERYQYRSVHKILMFLRESMMNEFLLQTGALFSAFRIFYPMPLHT